MSSTKVNISKQDVLRAMGSPDFMCGDLVESDDSQSQRVDPDADAAGHAKLEPKPHQKSQTHCDVDVLFKKGRGEKNKGYLKVKFLGNALKDYQLIRLADEGPTALLADGSADTNQKHMADSNSKVINSPTWLYFSRARKALGESRFIEVYHVSRYCFLLLCLLKP